MDAKLEIWWKWVLRSLGVAGFGYLLAFNPDAPIAFYALLGGLLGLPNVIAYQLAVNKAKADDDAHEKEHGYVP